MATGIALSAILCVVVFFWTQRDIRSPELPFRNRQEVIAEIKNLPIVQGAEPDVEGEGWVAYVSLAKRLKVTDSEIILRALGELSPSNRQDTFSIHIRTALLLRVCFECPSGSQAPYQQGWLYDGGRANFDANWPVQVGLGGFTLQSGFGGYFGPPYEPAEEFKWRLANCRWRDL
jgi:hypothetical protein